MTRKEHCHYRVNQCLGTGITKKGYSDDKKRSTGMTGEGGTGMTRKRLFS
jgi:hypothetical protein